MKITPIKKFALSFFIAATQMIGATTLENVIYRNDRLFELEAPSLTITHQPLSSLPTAPKTIHFSEEDTALLRAGTYSGKASSGASCKPIAKVLDILKGGLSTKATLTFPRPEQSIYMETLFKIEHNNSFKITYPHVKVRMFSKQPDAVPLVADLITKTQLSLPERHKKTFAVLGVVAGMILGSIIIGCTSSSKF